MPEPDRHTLQRWRPYVVLLVVVALSLVLPQRGDRGEEASTVVPPSGAGPGLAGPVDTDGEAGEPPVAGAGLTSADPVAGGRPRVPGPRAAVDAPAAAVSGRSAPVPTQAAASPAVTGAGVGSPGALSAPDCDGASGRIRISFTWRAPCVVPWPEGADNGGATSMGVTSDTIKVVFYYVSELGVGNASEMQAKWETHVQLFERFYRTWGRRVETVVVEKTGDDEVAQRADAIKIAGLKPFIAIGIPFANDVLITELARRGVLLQTSGAASVRLSDELAPYVWGSSVAPDEWVALNTAHYVGRRLLGHTAKWAGQPDYQVQQRKFAIVHPDTWDLRLFTEPFARYGGKLVDAVSYQAGQRYAATWGERSGVIAARLKAKGVTSVIAATDLLFTGPLTHAATSQNWFPEWITTGYIAQDLTLIARTFNQSQWRNAFGVGSIPIYGRVPWPQSWVYDWYWGSQGNGDGPSESQSWHLFTGIHLAGPRLTPETFRDGRFAFPPTGGPATGGILTAQMSWGRWGFAPWDDYNGFDDFSEIYWDASAVAPDLVTGQPTAGNYRHLNGGRRWLMDQWPTGEPRFFDARGTAIYYEDYPAADRPPDVECPADCPSRQ